MVLRITIARLAALAVAAILLLGAGGCGGDDSDEGNGDGAASGKLIPAREAAIAEGRKLCKVLGGRKGLANSFGTNDPKVLARRFAEEVYIGAYPRKAAQGCLEVIQPSPGKGS